MKTLTTLLAGLFLAGITSIGFAATNCEPQTNTQTEDIYQDDYFLEDVD